MPVTQFKLRRGTAAQWAAANPVLAQGEPGYATDVKTLKIGNGVETWNELTSVSDEAVDARIEAILSQETFASQAHISRLLSGPVTTAAGDSLLDFDYESRRDTDWAVDLAANTITVPRNGYYHLSVTISIQPGNATTEYVLPYVTDVNNVDYMHGTRQAVTGALRIVSNDVRYVPAGTVLRAKVFTSGPITYVADGSDGTAFTVTFLGNVTGGAVFPGDRLRVGSRPLDANEYVKLQTFHDDAAGMAIWTQKIAGDSGDINIDGAIVVKHGKGYTGTPGYADTVQFYTLAGSAGSILGNNNFTELGPAPYAIPGVWNANGYVRFELGPSWPSSEVGRFNNGGDLLLGFAQVGPDGLSSASQAGTTVTATAGIFTADMVGKHVVWAGGGGDGTMDRITAFTNSTTVTVERARTKATQNIRIFEHNVEVKRDGTVIVNAVGKGIQARSADGTLYKLAPPNGGGAATWVAG